MARKAEPGLSFYRMNCGHSSNRKVRLLFNEFNSDGYWIWQCILDHSYDIKGYYFDCNDKDALELFATDVCKKQVSLVNEVITGCVRRGLFDKSVFDMFGVLTSVMMQEIYLDATKERRKKGTEIEFKKEYLLVEIKPAEVNISIVPAKKEILPGKNPINPGRNTQSIVEYSKEEKSIVIGDVVPPPPQKETPPKKTVEQKQTELKERVIVFGLSLKDYENLYSREMLLAFYNYWKEPNKSKSKMKFEMEPTWDLRLRLIRWEKNQHQYRGNNGKNDDNSTDLLGGRKIFE